LQDARGRADWHRSGRVLSQEGSYELIDYLKDALKEIEAMPRKETALISKTADQHDTVPAFEPIGAKSVMKGEPLLLGHAGFAKATLEVKGRAFVPRLYLMTRLLVELGKQ
jgi:hypothetical protein